MKAGELYDGKLRMAERPKPVAGDGEVLIEITAAGVIPTELLWHPTKFTKAGKPRVGAIPGHEFAGRVAGVGPGAEVYQIGDAVYGMNDWFADGAVAEFCVTTPAQIAPAPRTLTPIEAASVPISALTAWQGLFDRGGLKPERRVLIQGGAGAVGIFAVQLAARAGAAVLATASARDRAFVESLGASEVIDYAARRFEDYGPFDLVFDTVGGETLDRSFAVLKPGGRVVTVAAQSETATDARLKQAFFIVEPSHEHLVEIASLLDAGALKTFVKAAVPLEMAKSAFDYSLPVGPARGKVVVVLQP